MEVKLLAGNSFTLNTRPTRYTVAVNLIRAVTMTVCTSVTAVVTYADSSLANSRALQRVQFLQSVEIVKYVQVSIIFLVGEIVPPLLFYHTAL